MKLTIDKAREILKRESNKIKNVGDRDFNIMHSEHVVKIAKILASKKNLDNEILELAGLLHDIGKAIGGKNHAQCSVEILEKEGFELDNKLRDCILQHGGDKTPTTDEGKIIRWADKISVLNPEIMDLVIKTNEDKISEEDIKFIKKMTSKAVNFLGEIELK